MSAQEVMESCDNCHQSFPQNKIPTHFRYCRLNFIKCLQCGLMYDRQLEEEHTEEYHSLQQCQHCSMEFSGNEVKVHEEGCQEKKRYCQYCDLKVPVKIYQKHYSECEARTKNCQKCRRPIANKNYASHNAECSRTSMFTGVLPYGFVANPLSYQKRSAYQHSSSQNNSEEADEDYSEAMEDSNYRDEDEQLNYAIAMSMNQHASSERSAMSDRNERYLNGEQDIMMDEDFLTLQRAIEQQIFHSKK